MKGIGSSKQINQLHKNLKRFRLITFDVTDTLLSFKEPPAVQYARTAMRYGVTNLDKGYMQECFRKEFKAMTKLYPNFGCHSKDFNWQMWWIELIERIFKCQRLNISTADTRKVAQELLDIYQTKECYMHTTGSEDFLQHMKDTGKHLAVISNFDSRLQNVLRAMCIDHYFDYVFTSYDTGYEKPNKEIFEVVQNHFRVLPHEALHIGNIYEIDYKGAKNAGWSSILLMKNNKSSTHCDPNKLHTFEDLDKLLYALKTKEIKW